MKKILVINSSIKQQGSYSKQLAEVILNKLLAKHPESTTKSLDLSVQPLPHLEEAQFLAFYTPPDKHTDAQKAALGNSDRVIKDLLEADIIVLGVPMYNFSIPSTLKAWIDHVARVGVTFNFTETGSVGLLKDKKAYIAISSGNIYTEGPVKDFDFTENYLRAILGFMGIKDVSVFRVEGVAIPGVKETALEKAIASINL